MGVRRLLLMLLALLFSAHSLAGQSLRIAVATTADETGLVSHLVQEFRISNPDVSVDLITTGAINALGVARSGAADAVITHHPPSEGVFVADGYGLSRTLIMSNGFAIFGPASDLLGLARESDIVQIMRKIAAAEPEFFVQGDNSGTFRKLQEVWAAAEVAPDWIGYESTGSSSKATLLLAAQAGAYTFADMGTYLSLRAKIGGAIVPLVRDHNALQNVYSYLVVNPEKVPGVNRVLAERFLNWLVSDAAQSLIGDYGQTRFAAELYKPMAHLDEGLRATRAATRQQSSQRYIYALISVAVLLMILALWAVVSFRMGMRLQARTKASEERFSLAVAGSQDGIWDWDVTGQKFFYSERAAQVLGLPIQQSEYRDLASMVRDATSDETWSGGLAAVLLDCLSGASTKTLDIDFPVKTGASLPSWARLKGSALFGPKGNIVRVSGSVSDTTDTRRHAEEIRLRSITDELTGLPNRAALMPHIAAALCGASRDGTQAALFVLDIDGFRRVNDTLGHHVGDELIRETAHRLRSVMRETDYVVRLGGDEFAVFMRLSNEVQARHAGNKMRVALKRPVIVGEHILNIDASIGCAFFPDHGDNAAALLRHAEVAMYQSKRVREPFSIYVVEMDPNSLRSLRLENDLRTAIADGALQLYYQPKIHLPSRSLSGVEALLRWIHPEHGFIPPIELIPLAERTGLIRPLTRWIVDEALSQQAEWAASGLQISVAINLSIWDLEDPSLVRFIEQRIRKYGSKPERVEFEITESMMMTDPEGTLATLNRLRQLGVRLSIDDFGTGFSSLAYLKRFPVTTLKIDKTFVQRILDKEKDQAIVRSIIALAHSLDLDVVGEGVEDIACMNLLGELGCDIAQGYYISRAVTAAELVRWLTRSDFGYAKKPQITSYRSFAQ